MLWVPTPSAAVVRLALPADSATVPSGVAPSMNVTLPVGVLPAPVTVAVNVTDWPNVLGLGEAVRAVVVALWLTVCVCTGDVLPV
jgi:hypothetical protein